MKTRQSTKKKFKYMELPSKEIDYLMEKYNLKIAEYKKLEADYGLMFVRKGRSYILLKKDEEILDLLGPVKVVRFRTEVDFEIVQMRLWKIKHEIFPLIFTQVDDKIVIDFRDIFKEYKEGTIK